MSVAAYIVGSGNPNFLRAAPASVRAKGQTASEKKLRKQRANNARLCVYSQPKPSVKIMMRVEAKTLTSSTPSPQC